MCIKTTNVFRSWHAESTFQSCGLEHDSYEPSPLDTFQSGITETRTTFDRTCDFCTMSSERLSSNTAFLARAVDRLAEILYRKLHQVVQIFYSHGVCNIKISLVRDYIEFINILQAEAKTCAINVANMINDRTHWLSSYEDDADDITDRELLQQHLETLDIRLRRVSTEISHGEDPLTFMQSMEPVIDRLYNDACALMATRR
ncbi:hypothetical protein BDV97DRAFT_360849 [Delphinella strobiligena]|nr:hypothetical protein BDV97DRAFT_360849 [Delphinella strobiligena]